MFGKKESKTGKTATKKSAAKKTTSTKAKAPAATKEKTAKSSKIKSQTQELAEYIKSKQTEEPETQYIANEAHYEQVIERIKNVKKTLWIGTADIKDLYVKDGRGSKPLLEVLSDLAEARVEIRLIHTKEPGPAFREDFDKYPALIEGVERVLCPRVHFKIIVFDLKTAYVGSANLTGASLGLKGENTRNFEAGVLSSNKEFVKNAASQFDSVWMGSYCKDCKRKQFCSDLIV